MKYLHEYRKSKDVNKYAEAIARVVRHPWNLMEVCGGQTHSIIRYGIDDLLPKEVNLIHGPGCPVCVTPVEKIDQAYELSLRKDVVFCTFGDMLRVPGTNGDLFSARAKGACVRMVYSPLDALKLAQKYPEKKVVFFAVGFETTAPAIAMTAFQAKKLGLKNFFLLVSHVLVPPAMQTILESPQNKVNGFLAAGHVCTVMGVKEYQNISNHFQVPIVVTGFEPLDIIYGIYLCIKQLEGGRFEVENAYSRAVLDEGNQQARNLIAKVFKISDRKWRGFGEIPTSGLELSDEYQFLDAVQKFDLGYIIRDEDPHCKAGLVLQGVIKPFECPAFGSQCIPEKPLGATMVSSEGACAAYYRYRKQTGKPNDEPMSNAAGMV